MASDEERLVVLLEARVRDFEKSMDRAAGTAGRSYDRMRRGSQGATAAMERDMARATSRVNSMLASTSTRIGDMGKTFAGGLVGGIAGAGLAGLVGQLRDVAKGVASIGDEAKRAGLSTRAFQELKFVAEQSRVGVDALVDGMKELSLRADEFIVTGQGSAAEAFRRLGYDAASLKEKLADPSALLAEIIGKVKDLDKAAQIRIFDELFGGTGGEQFVQLIGQGEAGIRALTQAAHESGAVLSDQLIDKAAELDRKFQAVATTVGNGLKAAIIEAASALADFATKLQGILPTVQGLAGNIPLPAGTTVGPGGALVSNVAVLEGQRSQVLKDIRITENGINAGIESRVPADLIAVEQERLTALREQLGIVEEQIRQQQRLNAEKERTVQLDEVTVTGPPQVPFSPLPAGDMTRSIQLQNAREQIAAQESAGSGGYAAVGPVTKNGDRAYGRYQVMGNNIGPWSKEALGVALTRDQFMNNPGYQDRVFDHRFGGYLDQYGPEGAGRAWFGGEGAVNGPGTGTDVLGTSVDSYGKQFAGGMAQAGTAVDGLTDKWENLRTVTADTSPVDAQKAAFDQLGQIGMGALNSLVGALADGKLEGRELLGILVQVVQQLLAMPSGPGGGAGGILGALFSGITGGGSADPWAGLRVPSYASGTRFHPGGLARINDGGGGEIVDLPRGARVVPHDVSMRMAESQAPAQNAFTFAPSYNVQGGSSEDIAKLKAQMARDQEQFRGRVLQTVRDGQRRGALAGARR